MSKDRHPKSSREILINNPVTAALIVFGTMFLVYTCGTSVVLDGLASSRVMATAEYMQTPQAKELILESLPQASKDFSFRVAVEDGANLTIGSGTATLYKNQAGKNYFVSAGHVVSNFDKPNLKLNFFQPQVAGSLTTQVDSNISWALHPQKDVGIFTVNSDQFLLPPGLPLYFPDSYQQTTDCSLLGFAGATENYDGWHTISNLPIDWAKNGGEEVSIITSQTTSGGDSGAAYFCSNDTIYGLHVRSNSLAHRLRAVPLLAIDIQLLESQLELQK